MVQCVADTSFIIHYNTNNNEYVLMNDNVKFNMRGWESASYRYRNIYHKTEYDWNMVYLARNSHSDAEIGNAIAFHFYLFRY